MSLNLNDPKVLEAIKWHVNQAVVFDLVDRAYAIFQKLPKFLLETPVENPDNQLEYQNILTRARFIALPLLRETEIAELLQTNFITVFDLPDYDLWAKLKNKLISVPVFEERDILKKKVREALLICNQVLTKEGLILDAKSVKGTVKNWVTDYHRALGTGRVETVQLSQYLIGGTNTKILSEESRKKLDYLLKFYEKLKVSSMEFEGVEEPMIFNVEGEIDIFEGGITERISREEKEILKKLEGIETAEEIKDELAARFRGGAEKVKKIEEEKNKILKNMAGDFKKLANELWKSINPQPGQAPNKIRVEAILKILAEQGVMENLLEEKRFNEMMVVYFREKGKTVELEGFKVNPRAPQYVAALLQHILQDKVGMNKDESGQLGMQLFNVLAKKGLDSKYQGLVYFDLESREFRWA